MKLIYYQEFHRSIYHLLTASCVITGDTLFLAGCGRFFEGTPEQMYGAMSILGSLPDNTKVYCGHEYTVQNLKFAAHVEPKNELIKKKLDWAIQRREEGKPTVCKPKKLH